MTNLFLAKDIRASAEHAARTGKGEDANPYDLMKDVSRHDAWLSFYRAEIEQQPKKEVA